MTIRMGMALVAAAAAIALAGCGSDKNDSGGSGTAQAPAGSASAGPKATVKFTTPRDGATVASKFTAKVKLAHFQIDAKDVGRSPMPGKGHLHFSLDGGKFDDPAHSGPNGKLAQQLGVDGKYSPSLKPQITYSDIPPGKHTLEVYLANNNHTNTGIEAKTELTVK